MVMTDDHMTDYVMQFWGDAMLTIGSYGSPGTCIVNCAINVVSSVFLKLEIIQAHIINM